MFMVFLLYLCISDLNIRNAFAKSAIGHIAYLTVRIGPVFKLGSIYMDEEDKKIWTKLSDRKRFSILLDGRYKWLSLELTLLSSIVIYFAYLRIVLFFHEIQFII
jgi:hypothetical protein